MENERKNNYKAVIEAAEAHLQMQNCTAPEKTLSGPELYTALKDKVEGISKNTIIQYLSSASRDQETNLYTQGCDRAIISSKKSPRKLKNMKPPLKAKCLRRRCSTKDKNP